MAEDKRWTMIVELLQLGDLPAPSLILDDQGQVSLDWWRQAYVDIAPDGSTNWAFLDRRYGTDFGDFKSALQAYQFNLAPATEDKTAIMAMRERAAAIADEWVRAYPTDIFIEPPPGQHGQSVDACSARAGRYVAGQIAAAIRRLNVGDKRDE